MISNDIELGEDKRQAHRRLPALSGTISPAEMRERGRLAELLHDDVCQFLSLAQIKLSMSRQTDNIEERSQLAASAEELVKRANRSVRAMMLQMVQPRPMQNVLAGSVEWVAQDIEQLYGIKINLLDDGQHIGVRARIVLVQCLRELLVNVAKHAKTNEATVTIGRLGDIFQLIVADQGQGFIRDPLADEDCPGGFGLASIRERVSSIGGHMSISSAAGQGTTVTIKVPAQSTTSSAGESW